MIIECLPRVLFMLPVVISGLVPFTSTTTHLKSIDDNLIKNVPRSFCVGPTRRVTKKSTTSQLCSYKKEARNDNYYPIVTQHDNHDDVKKCKDSLHVATRRNVLQSIVSLSSIGHSLTITPQESLAASVDDKLISVEPNFQCLTNLPSITPGYIRLYLCRHGQTEYNRLKLIQGARSDIPLNDTGRKQATRLGKALSHLGRDSYSDRNSIPILKVGRHSSLLRARETAIIASITSGSIGQEKFLNRNGDINDYALGDDDETIQFVSNNVLSRNLGNEFSASKATINISSLELQTLSTLGEVDFGPLNEGTSTTIAKAEMYRTYGSWAVGNIDAKLGGGGESGREVLTRAASALHSLIDIATQNGGSAIAISHSTYLRMMLALVMDMPLLQAASFEQKNCCVNVLDVSIKEMRKVNNYSNLFGVNSLVPNDFELIVPLVKVIKVNEVDHLAGLE